MLHDEPMTAISTAARGLAGAFALLDDASLRLLGAVHGGGQDMGAAFADMALAKIQAKASVATIHFADEMWRDLLELQGGP